MMLRIRPALLSPLVFAVIICAIAPSGAEEPAPGWPVVGGAQGGGHFTPLTQITAANVDQLREVWVYHTGDYSPGAPGHRATTFEATPILANDTLYFALPTTGCSRCRLKRGS